MNDSELDLCRKLISDLIVPAFCTKDGCVVAANSRACNLFPVSLLGAFVYNLFPEAKVVSEFCQKDFDVVSVNGIESANVTSFLSFELWQLTPAEHTPPRQNSAANKNDITILLAQINLLQRHYPEQNEIFNSIYKSCCKLLKASLSESDPSALPVLYVFDLAKEVQDFIKTCSEVFYGLELDVKTEELCRFTYVSADKNVLDNILAGMLCLCAHESNRGGSISISVTKKLNRALLSFSISNPCENETANQADKELTKKILQNNISKLGGILLSVSDSETPTFIVSLPASDNEYLLYEYPLFPSVGIPAHLIQLSALLPPEFYSKLN